MKWKRIWRVRRTFCERKKNATFTTLFRCFIANNHKTRMLTNNSQSWIVSLLILYWCALLGNSRWKARKCLFTSHNTDIFFFSLLISFKVTFNNFPDCWAYNNISYIYFCCKITNNSFETAYFNRKRWKTNNIQYRRETVKEKKMKYTQHMFANTHTLTHNGNNVVFSFAFFRWFYVFFFFIVA